MKKIFYMYVVCCLVSVQELFAFKMNEQGGFARQAAGATAKTVAKAGAVVGDIVYRAPKKALSALAHPQQSARDIKKFVGSPKKTFNDMKDRYQVSKNIAVYPENEPLHAVKTNIVHNKATTGNRIGDIGMPLIRIGDSLGNVYKSVRSALSPQYAAKRELNKISNANLTKNVEREQQINASNLEEKTLAKEQQFKKDFPDRRMEDFVEFPGYDQKMNKKFGLKRSLPGNALVSEHPKEHYRSFQQDYIQDGNHMGRDLKAEQSAAVSAAKNTKWYTRLFNRDELKKNIKNAIQNARVPDTPEAIPF